MIMPVKKRPLHATGGKKLNFYSTEYPSYKYQGHCTTGRHTVTTNTVCKLLLEGMHLSSICHETDFKSCKTSTRVGNCEWQQPSKHTVVSTLFNTFHPQCSHLPFGWSGTKKAVSRSPIRPYAHTPPSSSLTPTSRAIPPPTFPRDFLTHVRKRPK